MILDIFLLAFNRTLCFLIGHKEPVYLTCPVEGGPLPYCLRCRTRGSLPT